MGSSLKHGLPLTYYGSNIELLDAKHSPGLFLMATEIVLHGQTSSSIRWRCKVSTSAQHAFG